MKDHFVCEIACLLVGMIVGVTAGTAGALGGHRGPRRRPLRRRGLKKAWFWRYNTYSGVISASTTPENDADRRLAGTCYR